MRRFFFREDQRQGNKVILSERESHHISRVLRLETGDLVELCERSGKIYAAEIINTGKQVMLHICEEMQGKQSSLTKLYIGQGAIKSKKIELILQKCTELGVDGFHLFVSERSQMNIIRQYQGKNERWLRIIEEACKQCLRPRPMEVNKITSFEEMLAFQEDEENSLRLLCWEKEKNLSLASYASQFASSSSVILLFGPEGGFTDQEITKASSKGWRPVGLGERILRAETAAIAAVSIVQHYLGHI